MQPRTCQLEGTLCKLKVEPLQLFLEKRRKAMIHIFSEITWFFFKFLYEPSYWKLMYIETIPNQSLKAVIWHLQWPLYTESSLLSSLYQVKVYGNYIFIQGRVIKAIIWHRKSKYVHRKKQIILLSSNENTLNMIKYWILFEIYIRLRLTVF